MNCLLCTGRDFSVRILNRCENAICLRYFKYKASQYANMGRRQMRVSVSISVTLINTLPLQPLQTFKHFIPQTVAWIVAGSDYTREKLRAIPNALEDSFEFSEAVISEDPTFRRNRVIFRCLGRSYQSLSKFLKCLSQVPLSLCQCNILIKQPSYCFYVDIFTSLGFRLSYFKTIWRSEAIIF